MSVWNSIVGQAQVVEQLKAIASGDPKAIAQSWLIAALPDRAVPTLPARSPPRSKAPIMA